MTKKMDALLARFIREAEHKVDVANKRVARSKANHEEAQALYEDALHCLAREEQELARYRHDQEWRNSQKG